MWFICRPCEADEKPCVNQITSRICKTNNQPEVLSPDGTLMARLSEPVPSLPTGELGILFGAAAFQSRGCS